MLEWRNLLLVEGGHDNHREVARTLQHEASAQFLGLSSASTRKLDRGRMSPPGHFSAGVGQEPQTPALAPHPHPALHSLSGWYKMPGWSLRPGDMANREQAREGNSKEGNTTMTFTIETKPAAKKTGPQRRTLPGHRRPDHPRGPHRSPEQQERQGQKLQDQRPALRAVSGQEEAGATRTGGRRVSAFLPQKEYIAMTTLFPSKTSAAPSLPLRNAF
jgi:hypothetical protein